MELSELAKRASKYVVGTEGNVSEYSGGSFLIKRSGTRLEDCDFVGSDDPEASIEASFHEAIYEISSCNFICHTHPINLLKILCSDQALRFSQIRLFPDHVVFNPDYCVVPYAHPGKQLTDQILRSASAFDKFPSVFLLENHGLITYGTAKQAIIATEICEKAAEIYLSSTSIDEIARISLGNKQIQAIKDDCKEKKRGSIR